MADKTAHLGQNLWNSLGAWGRGEKGRVEEMQPRIPWDDGERSIKTFQAQRQGLAQAKIQGRTLSSLPQICSLYQLTLLAKLSHSKNCFGKIKKYYINVDSRGALASTSVIALTAKVDWSDVAGCEVSPSLTTLLVPHEEKKTAFQTEEDCPLVKILSM